MQIFRIITYYKLEKKFNVTIDALLFKKIRLVLKDVIVFGFVSSKQ